MKDKKDILIQQLLDGKGSELENILEEMIDDEDLEAYNLLYEALKEKPKQGLSYSYKSSVIRRIEAEKKQADDTLFYCALGMVSLVGASLIATMFYISKDAFASVFETITKFKGFIIIIIVFILLSKILDQRFIKNRV